MIRLCSAGLLMLFCATLPGAAETLQLKDGAAIVGNILSEKRDAVVVDIGYTVLVVPRDQIAKIVRSEEAESPAPAKPGRTTRKTSPAPPPVPPPLATPEATAGFYTANLAPGREQNVRDLVNLLGEAVVQVRTPSGIGSGFLINEEGFLITNFHVIEGETQISIEVYHQAGGQVERKTYQQVRIVAMNKFEDLALLRIEDKDAPKFRHVSLARTGALQVGERVFAIGSPLGLERTVTEGILSTATRQISGKLYLQTTTQINPGNSGGPLFNLAGEVVGVTNMKITFGEGLGFAIPVETVRYFLDNRDAFAYSNANPSNPYRYLEPPSRLRHQEPPE